MIKVLILAQLSDVIGLCYKEYLGRLVRFNTKTKTRYLGVVINNQLKNANRNVLGLSQRKLQLLNLNTENYKFVSKRSSKKLLYSCIRFEVGIIKVIMTLLRETKLSISEVLHLLL